MTLVIRPKRLLHKSYLHGADWYLGVDFIVSRWSKPAIKNLVPVDVALFLKILISKWTAPMGEWLMPPLHSHLPPVWANERARAHVSARATQMIYSRHLKRAAGCETSIMCISDWERDEEGRVTESDQYYILIGHNIYWELVKIHTFDLMRTLANKKMHFRPSLCAFYWKIHMNLVGCHTSELLIY